MKITGWMPGLEVTAGGTGVVSHAGVALLRALADRSGLTGGLSEALASDRLLVHDRGRVLADLACAIADGAEVISDFRVLGDQQELFGPVASVPTCWRALNEIAAGGQRMAARIAGAVNTARRVAWAGIEARHGAIPGIAVADKTLNGVTGLRLDATVVPCHSDKEGAEPNFKGFGLHPLGCWCDNTGEPLAAILRPGSAGSNTAAGHITVLGEAIAALPPKYRRRLMVTCDGAGASHDLIAHLDKLARAAWPPSLRVFARRERPHPGAQLTLFEAEDGWRYCLWVTNLPGRTAGWRGQLAYTGATSRRSPGSVATWACCPLAIELAGARVLSVPGIEAA